MSNENHLDPKAISGMLWRLRDHQKENDDAGFANQLPEGAGTSIYGQAADMIYALHAARAAEAPITRTKWLGPFTDAGQALDETRRAVAALLGADPETWPTHGNAPLAITAVVARRIIAQGQEQAVTDTGNPVSPGGREGSEMPGLLGKQDHAKTGVVAGDRPGHLGGDTAGLRWGNETAPHAVGDAQIRASSEGGDQSAPPLAGADPQSADVFEAWLARKYGAMFDPIGEEEADTISRIVKAVASSAWAAARRGAA